MQVSGASGGIFRSVFLDKGLVTFAECADHYRTMRSEALVEELRFLVTAPMLAIPFPVSSARYLALMSALIRYAGTDHHLADAHRTALVRICIDIGTFLQARAFGKWAEAYDTALDTALEAVRTARIRPEIADAIATGLGRSAPTAPSPEPVDDMQALDFREPPPALPLKLSA